MPEPTVAKSATTSPASKHGEHDDLLRSRISSCYMKATAQRQKALSDHDLELPDWYVKTTHQTRANLKSIHERYCAIFNQVDYALGKVQDIRTFAEPLLSQAIQTTFRRTLNVREVYFARKFAVKTRTDMGINLLHRLTGEGYDTYQYRGGSLLDVALANFEPDEEHKLDCDDCHLITTTPVSADGTLSHTLESVRAGALPIAPEAFIKLCRKLDLGRKYREHLTTILEPNDRQARERLDEQLREHHKQLLTISTEIAHAKADIRQDTYRMLQRVVGGQPSAELDGRAVTFATLTVLDVELVGPLLIGPERDRSTRLERVVAYIPDDPEHPVKEYASSYEFMVELRRRLHNLDYRRFFSRFVPLHEQGHFFERFNRLFKPSSQTDAKGDFPLKSNLPRLPMSASDLKGFLWETLRVNQVRKIYQDARVAAVPTGDEDKKARQARLESWESTVIDVLNMAAFVVPGLGQVMMAVWALQMLYEAFEGIEAFEQGETKEIWAHVSSLALNAAFMVAGAKVLPRIMPSATVDQLAPVTSPTGERRLWRPDLAPYRSDLEPPANSQPDALGLHRVNGRDVLPLDDSHYEVQQDPATQRYRIRHPSRPDAYQPELTNNGSGAWNHELEQPRSWDGTTLMRRLGHRVKDFSDAELEHIRTASGTSEDTLRRMHAEGEPVPVLLDDTIKRFDIARKVDAFLLHMQSEDPLIYEKADSMTQLHLLTGYGPWPENLKLKVIDSAGKSLWEYAHPTDGTSMVREVIVSDTEVDSSSFPRNLIEAVDATGNDLLAGTRPAIAKTDMNARIQQFRKNLLEVAVREKNQLIHDHYAKGDVSKDPRVKLIQSRFPSVPAAAIEQIMVHASPGETRQMAGWDYTDATQTKPLPLRIAEELRHFQRAIRLNRAYEGLYQESLATADTPRLALATLKTLAGWSDTVRIELREDFTSGRLIDSVGPSDSTQVKIVVKRDDLYQAHDDSGNDLSSEGSLYAALQHALPDAERQAMGRPSIHHGALLKTAIGAAPVSRGSLAKVLKMPAVKPLLVSPMRLASGRYGYPLGGPLEWLRLGRSPERRVRELFPDYSSQEARAFVRELGDRATVEIGRLETEYRTLRDELDRWVASTETDEGNDDLAASWRRVKQNTADRIRKCWRRQSRAIIVVDGRRVGYELDLSWMHMRSLPQLSADFSHVTFLKLNNMGLSQQACNGFLTRFPAVRWLDMSFNNLTEVPEALAAMPRLNNLTLASNQIGLTPRGVEILAGLPAMEFLTLNDNPLGRLPDFSAMPALTELSLRNTRIDTWPTGLLEQPLEELDLRANQLTEVPAHVIDPPADQAHAMARLNGVTFIQGNPMGEATRQRLREYWANLHQAHPEWTAPRMQGTLQLAANAPVGGRTGVRPWLRDLPPEQQQDRKDLWRSLQAEPQSGEFFQLLSRLIGSYQDTENYSDLQARVWQMLEAARDSTDLRRELFELAGEPACEDRASLSFSNLEIKLMIHNAKALPVEGDEAATLIRLAKGLFRLDEVERIALRDIQGRRAAINAREELTAAQKTELIRQIEEVEVRLAYRAGLRDRLELPGQPKGGRFTSLGNVSSAMLDAAAAEVLSLDDSPEQMQSLVGRDFWIDYLKQQHAADFQALTDALTEDLLALDEQKADGTLEEADYNSRTEALDLQQRFKEAELIQSLTQDELDSPQESTDL
ncbi:NEL-type E3 ubiquitin ligase domain-containing protein [Pseudomonas sp. D3-10]|uniref:NEL-type E3 ubiquitin ligase domain-containing protein n=1 Tax=Pseudomonas sp. D3-10 TaxID=2817392 RepID=UPI003DA8F22B